MTPTERKALHSRLDLALSCDGRLSPYYQEMLDDIIIFLGAMPEGPTHPEHVRGYRGALTRPNQSTLKPHPLQDSVMHAERKATS